MADREAPLAHVLVRDRVENERFHRTGGGDKSARAVERRAHGMARRTELRQSLSDGERERASLPATIAELKAIGVVIVLEGSAAAYPLKLESLERWSAHRKQAKRPMWLLLSVMEAANDVPERATVWVSDDYRARFLKLFEDYLTRETKKAQPLNRELVANIARIREAVTEDLWQSAGPPPKTGVHWWELFLSPTDDAVGQTRSFAAAMRLQMARQVLELNDRTVAGRGSLTRISSTASCEDLRGVSVESNS